LTGLLYPVNFFTSKKIACGRGAGWRLQVNGDVPVGKLNSIKLIKNQNVMDL
jgi:hypothetical protein